ncbi:MAG: hypothetical protein KGL39_20600 [Patescibacteria group bacterium]|nr:hypothetical protein [Patescibacteria group bacterium]
MNEAVALVLLLSIVIPCTVFVFWVTKAKNYWKRAYLSAIAERDKWWVKKTTVCRFVGGNMDGKEMTVADMYDSIEYPVMKAGKVKAFLFDGDISPEPIWDSLRYNRDAIDRRKFVLSREAKE